jgi:hypothetical protein
MLMALPKDEKPWRLHEHQRQTQPKGGAFGRAREAYRATPTSERRAPSGRAGGGTC